MKAWMNERFEVFSETLAGLTDESAIAQLCQSEIEYWRERGTFQSASSWKKPMTDFRNAIRQLPVTDAVAWVNQKGERVHIALKHMNYSPDEWRGMQSQSDENFDARLASRQFIDDPDAVVAKAVELLSSKRWADVVVGLAVTTGRRLSEVLKTGEFTEYSAYTVMFSGQLKKRAEYPAYEIPTLCEASLALSAINRLRASVDCTNDEIDTISRKYGPMVVATAQREFEALVPAREDDDLYTHLFRSVYGRIAVYYYARPETSDLKYMNEVYGHERDYKTTMHYSDYLIGDSQGNIDGRQGTHLTLPGVKVLDVFEAEKEGTNTMTKDTTTPTSDTTKSAKRGQFRIDDAELWARFQDIHNELGSRIFSETLEVIVKAYEQNQGVSSLLNEYSTTCEELSELLANAKIDAEKENAKNKDEKTPVQYLSGMLESKRAFRQTYVKRHEGKEYEAMSLSDLRNTKTPDAAIERFKRAVDAIMEYNNNVDEYDRWYINGAVVCELVGGRQSGDKGSSANEYLETRRSEIDAHHNSFTPAIRPSINRKPKPIIRCVAVPEYVGQAGDLEAQIQAHMERERQSQEKKEKRQ
jgi:hypothetical protein